MSSVLQPAPRRILVREVNWLGDVVMSLPALKAVRHAFPDSKISILIKKELAGFFDGSTWIDECIPFSAPKGWKGFGAKRKIVADIKSREYDLGILFPNSFESAWWFKRAKIKNRVGFARDVRGWLLTHKIKPDERILEVHQVNYYLHMLEKTLGVRGDPAECALDVHPPHREKMAAWLKARRKRPGKPLIALAVAAAYGPAKEWPAGHFARLIDLLAEKHGAECVLAGAPNEKAKSEAVIAQSKAGAINAAGETQIGEAIALLSLCSGFAGNDSGSMHLSGPLGIPTVGIYGSTRADRTGPLGPKTKIIYKPIPCSPCLKRTCKYGHYDCLNGISPEEVCQALEDLKAFG